MTELKPAMRKLQVQHPNEPPGRAVLVDKISFSGSHNTKVLKSCSTYMHCGFVFIDLM